MIILQKSQDFPKYANFSANKTMCNITNQVSAGVSIRLFLHIKRIKIDENAVLNYICGVLEIVEIIFYI